MGFDSLLFNLLFIRFCTVADRDVGVGRIFQARVDFTKRRTFFVGVLVRICDTVCLDRLVDIVDSDSKVHMGCVIPVHVDECVSRWYCRTLGWAHRVEMDWIF